MYLVILFSFSSILQILKLAIDHPVTCTRTFLFLLPHSKFDTYLTLDPDDDPCGAEANESNVVSLGHLRHASP